MRKALKPGGLLILQGYTPKQLDFGTGGPSEIEHLYTRAMLEQAFGDFRDVKFTEEELEMHEGAAHGGMSAVIGLTGRKPSELRAVTLNRGASTVVRRVAANAAISSRVSGA